MFTELRETLLDLSPLDDDQSGAASVVAARHARDKNDLAGLLDALGLPTDTDTLTALLPLLPETGDAPTMTTTPAAPALSAHEAMAISMHNNGDSEQAIREATGLSEKELSVLITGQVLGLPRAATDVQTIDIPVIPLPVSNEVQELLDWAAAHPAASVRSRAARISADLSELSDRRETEAAQREAEVRVARAKADLERAQEELRTLKAGTRTAVAAPAPIRTGTGGGRTREELAAIRTWARKNGHQVSDRGTPARVVLDAYAAAHPAPGSLAQAG
ncbi:histone-like nucleoid-structuring protein Lsr2 [Streptomyces sp. NPDC088341]|uniref:Lsr2 family DNA-binding protein n=1 Tax=Streptomyces sp. NPDC088341 TaxID=3154870 RepID=UPI0034196460